MELRLWIGLHSCLQCFILVISDASYIIKYITRFTEEGFSSLISFIFISDAIKKMVGSARQSSHIQPGSAISWPVASKTCVLLVKEPTTLGWVFKRKDLISFSQVGALKYYPINRGFKPDYITSYKCDCVPPDQCESFNSL